ncbi:Subtilisin-like protease SBT3.2 [Glycine soja]
MNCYWKCHSSASTTASYFVGNANYRGLASGLARGGAPLAHLAIYKACWDLPIGDCTDVDILKAFDKAIHDGVDVLSVSLGFSIPLFSYVDLCDILAIGSFHATAKGITVSLSTGTFSNHYKYCTMDHQFITVGATTIDRAFLAAITLGNNHTVWDGSRSAYDIGIGVNSTGFLSRKFLLGLVFALGLGFARDLSCVRNGFCG